MFYVHCINLCVSLFKYKNGNLKQRTHSCMQTFCVDFISSSSFFFYHQSYSAFGDKSKKTSTHLCERSKAKRHGASSSDIESRPLTYPRTPQCSVKTTCLHAIDADCIDDYARLLFPICFVIFNIIYWLRFRLL